jgi:hypothetical protein
VITRWLGRVGQDARFAVTDETELWSIRKTVARLVPIRESRFIRGSSVKYNTAYRKTDAFCQGSRGSAEVDHDNYIVGSFGDSPKMATELADLAVAGIKRATASLARDSHPVFGALSQQFCRANVQFGEQS